MTDGPIREMGALPPPKVKKRFGLTPTELRQRAGASDVRAAAPACFGVRLSYRPPFDWLAFLDFLSARATPGVESVKEGVYRRTVRSCSGTGAIGVWQSEEPNTLTLQIEGRFSRQLLPIVDRVRDLFDLRADPHKIESHLKQSKVLEALLDGRSVPRVPGAWDGFELAVRAILGQQVSVRGATTVAGRLAVRYGEPATGDTAGLTVLFPEPESLAVAEIENCGFPRARGRAITLLARGRLRREAFTRALRGPGNRSQGIALDTRHRAMDRGLHYDARFVPTRCVSGRGPRSEKGGIDGRWAYISTSP